MTASPLPNGREKSQVRKSLYLVVAAREMVSFVFSNKLSDLVLIPREEVGWVPQSSEMEGEGSLAGSLLPPLPSIIFARNPHWVWIL